MALINTFSSSAMRDLNKFKLYCDGKLIFEAWTNENLKFDLSLDTQSLFGNGDLQSIGGKIGTAYAIASQTGIATSLFGTSPNMGGLSFETKNLYRGSKCLSHDINCYLTLRNSYQEDIADPLNTLMEYFAPELDDSTPDSSKILNGFKGALKDKRAAVSSSGGDSAGDLMSIMTEIFNNSQKFLGTIKMLKLPKAYQNSARLDVEFGSWRIERVSIKNISIELPPPMYKNPRGGKPLPDYAKVHMTIETLRPVHSKTINFNL